MQLVDGGGAVDIAGDQERVAALLAQVNRQLGGVGRLAGALETDQHHDLRRAVGRAQRLPLGAEDADQFLVDDADHRLRRGQRFQDILTDGPLAHGGDEVLDDLEIDVGLEQRPADLVHRLVDVRFGQPPLARELAKGFGQSIGK